MARDTSEEVAAAARRRLALLGRELALASGVAPVDDTAPSPALEGAKQAAAGPPFGAGGGAPAEDREGDLGAGVEARVVPEPGRHARPARGAASGRLSGRLAGRVGGWVADRVPETLRGTVAVRGPQLAVLALVAGVALAIAAVLVLRSRPTVADVAAPRPAAALVTASPGAGTSPQVSPNGAGQGSSTSGRVVVDVAGKVRHPGVRTLPAGSRVVDAIRRAGGPRKGVELTSLNLARVLVDGEQILVGVSAAPGVASSAAASSGGTGGPLVNLNTSTQSQLESLPGVGPVTAGKIVSWRTEHGAFTAVDDLLEVDGIGEKTLAEIAPHVTL